MDNSYEEVIKKMLESSRLSYQMEEILSHDIFYQELKEKVVSGLFIEGDCLNFSTSENYKAELRKFESLDCVAQDKVTDEFCFHLVKQNRLLFSQVPVCARTNRFYINMFSYPKTQERIKQNIENFDKKFFKDLIATNPEAVNSNNNCFEIMPLAMIDEEICTLAFMKARYFTDSAWFYTVCRRKPEVLTENMWRLAARLYGSKDFVTITPDEYKDRDYYLELCKCTFQLDEKVGMVKREIIDCVPLIVRNADFLIELLSDDFKIIKVFNDRNLNTVVSTNAFGKEERLWQFIIRLVPQAIGEIPLNDEIVNFYKNHFKKNTLEYDLFLNNYRSFLQRKRLKLGYVMKAKLANPMFIGLPSEYRGLVPEKYLDVYDKDEYLKFVYEMLGVQLIGINDLNFYVVKLPDNYKIVKVYASDYFNLVDDRGNIVLTYFLQKNQMGYCAYVTKIYVKNLKKNEEGKIKLQKQLREA